MVKLCLTVNKKTNKIVSEIQPLIIFTNKWTVFPHRSQARAKTQIYGEEALHLLMRSFCCAKIL